MTLSNTDLQMALIGYERRRAELDGIIATIHARIQAVKGASSPAQSKPKRTISPEARERMAKAQKRRWRRQRRQQREEVVTIQ
jgi:hypothetical protein